MRVQALRPELAIERPDEAVVGRLAGPGELDDNALLIGPQIEITADELRALVNPDRRRIADGREDTVTKIDRKRAYRSRWPPPSGKPESRRGQFENPVRLSPVEP